MDKLNRQICKNLKLSIELGDDEIKIVLADDLNLISTEVCYPINVTTLHLDAKGRGVERPRQLKYATKEAIVIGLRRVVDEAIRSDMIDLNQESSTRRGVLMTLNIEGE